MISNRARADFITVHYHIVLIGNDSEFLGVSFGVSKSFHATFWHRKRIVTEVNFLRFFVVFVKRKISNPSKRNFVFVFQVEVRGKFIAESAKNFINNFAFIGAKKHRIARLCASFFGNSCEFFFAQEFRDRTSNFAFFENNVSQTARAFTFGDFGEAIDLFSAQACAVFDTNRFHAFGIFEHAKFSFSQNFVQINQFHSKTQIWLVGAVFFHRFKIRNTWNFFTEKCFLSEIFHQIFDQNFHFRADFFAIFNESALQIELIKIAIKSVSSRIFVAETSRDLVVFFNSANHQKLLELLWSLR